MVQAAEADVVGPTVTSVHPERLAGEHVAHRKELAGSGAPLLLKERDERIGRGTGRRQVVEGGQEGVAGFAERPGGCGGEGFGFLPQQGAPLLHRQAHAQAELGVILEEAVGPRRAEAAAVDRIRYAGHSSAPGLRAASGVGPVDTVTEKLGEELGIRGLATSRAGCRELEQRAAELASLDSIWIEKVALVLEAEGILETCLVLLRKCCRHHLQGPGGATLGTASAARAVQFGHCQGEMQALGLAVGRNGNESLRRGGLLGIVQEERSDDGMGADEGAAVALDALGRIPAGNPHRDAALLVGRKTERDAAIRIVDKAADRKVVALLPVDRQEESAHRLRQIRQVLSRRGRKRSPRLGDRDFGHLGSSGLDGGDVSRHDLVALGEIGLARSGLHGLEGLGRADDAGSGEERRLEHGVGMATQAETESHGRGVDDVETCMLLRQGAFHVSRQPFLQLSAGMTAVQQENASVLEFGDYVVLSDVALVVACDEVRMLHIIGTFHRLAAEAEMGLGYAE